MILDLISLANDVIEYPVPHISPSVSAILVLTP
jgi:hypothetical protein